MLFKKMEEQPPLTFLWSPGSQAVLSLGRQDLDPEAEAAFREIFAETLTLDDHPADAKLVTAPRGQWIDAARCTRNKWGAMRPVLPPPAPDVPLPPALQEMGEKGGGAC